MGKIGISNIHVLNISVKFCKAAFVCYHVSCVETYLVDIFKQFEPLCLSTLTSH